MGQYVDRNICYFAGGALERAILSKENSITSSYTFGSIRYLILNLRRNENSEPGFPYYDQFIIDIRIWNKIFLLAGLIQTKGCTYTGDEAVISGNCESIKANSLKELASKLKLLADNLKPYLELSDTGILKKIQEYRNTLVGLYKSMEPYQERFKENVKIKNAFELVEKTMALHDKEYANLFNMKVGEKELNNIRTAKIKRSEEAREYSNLLKQLGFNREDFYTQGYLIELLQHQINYIKNVAEKISKLEGCKGCNEEKMRNKFSCDNCAFYAEVLKKSPKKIFSVS